MRANAIFPISAVKLLVVRTKSAALSPRKKSSEGRQRDVSIQLAPTRRSVVGSSRIPTDEPDSNNHGSPQHFALQVWGEQCCILTSPARPAENAQQQESIDVQDP